MSEWIEAAENALKKVKDKTKVPFDFERFEEHGENLPDTYIVYFLVSAPPGLSADNTERAYIPKIQVSLFYRKKRAFLELPDTIIQALTAAGFIRAAEGRIPYNTNTGHYGWRCEFNFYERR